MNVKKMLKVCEEKGRFVSRSALYSSGLKYGFIGKGDGEHYWTVNEEKFMGWVEKGAVNPESGYVKVSELPAMFGCSKSKCYNVTKKPGCVTKRYGAGRGTLYVEVNSFERIINSRGGGDNEEK